MSWMLWFVLLAGPAPSTSASSCGSVLAKYGNEIRQALVGSAEGLHQRMVFLRLLEKQHPLCFRTALGRSLLRQRKTLAPDPKTRPRGVPSPCAPVYKRYTRELEKGVSANAARQLRILQYLYSVEKTFPDCFQTERGKGLIRERTALNAKTQPVEPAPAVTPWKKKRFQTRQRYTTKRKRIRGLVTSGAIMFSIGYGISLLVGIITASSDGAWLMIPIVGPVVLGAVVGGSSGPSLALSFGLLLGVPQLLGAIFLIVGLVGKKRTVKVFEPVARADGTARKASVFLRVGHPVGSGRAGAF